MVYIKFTNSYDYTGKAYYSFFVLPLLKIFKAKNIFVEMEVLNGKDVVPDIEFFSVFGNKEDLINSKAKHKIFFTGENVSVSSIAGPRKQYSDHCLQHTALSLGFDFGKAENYLRLPLWLLYYFRPYDSKDVIQHKLTEFAATEKKEKFCALIARHDTTEYVREYGEDSSYLVPGNSNNLRTEMYNKISQIGQVDCPGFLLHNDASLKTQFSDNKDVYLRQYKFNICPENSQSPGYVTEKIFDAFHAGCIPVYNGYSSDPEPGIINPQAILWFERGKDNAETLERLKQLYENEREYDDFQEQGFFVDSAVDGIHGYLQAYCEQMENIALQCI
ncbi:MAG: hypothetical protein LBJ25_05680 [Candidatus Margulisbacteria bacterium]|jgi:hypothetical protein|nr:hypothetical protein [Candidatus Margulisiibacteriota bacterium]